MPTVKRHKLSRAALVALVAGLVGPAVSGARTAPASPIQTAPAASKKTAPAAKSKKPAARIATASSAASGKRSRVLARPKGSEWAAPSNRRRAKRVIRQDDSHRVILADASTVPPSLVYGPFLPVEAFDYPPAPCAPTDVPLEAHLHDENLDSDEAQASEEPPAEETATQAASTERLLSSERLMSVARRIGSFLRPKSASAEIAPEDVDLAELLSANLRIPVEGVDAERLRDSFLDRRGRYRKHLAIDIGAPRGTPVIATADGEITLLRRENRGGITVYQKDTSGKYLFFYCHLSKYARGLAVGQRVAAGETIGYVGATGHVIGGPHLHFSITRLPEGDDFHKGLAVNPYLLFLAGVP